MTCCRYFVYINVQNQFPVRIRREMNASNNFTKTDLRYWEKRVTFQLPASRTYSVHIQHGNRRMWINLRTNNKEQAAITARSFTRICALSDGMKFFTGVKRPGGKEGQRDGRRILEAVATKSLFSPKTFQSYAQALRKIAGDIAGVAGREKRDAIKLRTITPEKIEAWRIEFIRRKATDPLREKSARISVGSFILRARSLFSVETVARIRDLVEIPERLPSAASRSRACTGRATGRPSTW